MGFPLALCAETEPLNSLDSRVAIRNEMAAIHNILIRGLNSMHENAPRVPAGSADVRSFCGYVATWADILHIHHTGEEEHFFPVVQAKLGAEYVADNVEQHKEIHVCHSKIMEWLKKTLASPAGYSGVKLVAILDEHAEAIALHMHAELDTLNAEKLSGAFEEKEFRKIVADWVNGEIKKSQKSTVLPFAVMHAHKVRLPGPVVWFTKNVLYWIHSDYWKFCPYDRSGRTQTYENASKPT